MNKSAMKACACGCNIPVNGRSDYRQGHDARHVSILAQSVIDGIFSLKQACDVVAHRPSLVAKVSNQVQRAIAKASGSKQPKDRQPQKLSKSAAQDLAESDAEAAARRQAPELEWDDTDRNHPVVQAKVGRWVYSGFVAEDEFVYTDKKGNQQMTTNFTLV